MSEIFSTNKNVNIEIIKYFSQSFRDLKDNQKFFIVVFSFYGSLANIIFRWDHHGFKQFRRIQEKVFFQQHEENKKFLFLKFHIDPSSLIFLRFFLPVFSSFLILAWFYVYASVWMDSQIE